MNDISFLKNNKIDVDKCISELGIETYNELMGVFLDEIMDRINKINESYTNHNLNDYSTYVHAVKGESLYLGFKDLANITLIHQTKADEGDFDYISKDYNNLIDEICRVIKIVRIYLGRE